MQAWPLICLFFLFHCNTINLFIRRALFQISKLLYVYYWAISSCLLLWNKTSLFHPCMTFEDLFIQCGSSICFLHPDNFPLYIPLYFWLAIQTARSEAAAGFLLPSLRLRHWLLLAFLPFEGRGETTQNLTQVFLLHPLLTEISTTRQLWDVVLSLFPSNL